MVGPGSVFWDGAGLRAAYPGGAGLVRLDIARGYRDGDIAVSVVYTSALP